MQTSLQPAWNPPLALVVLSVIGLAVIVALAYWNGASVASRPWKLLLAGIRTLLVTIAFVLLYGWMVQRHRTALPDLVIAVDDSASMGLTDPSDDARLAARTNARLAAASMEEPSRINLANILLLENDAVLLRELQRQYKVRIYRIASEARLIGGNPDQVRTQLKQLSAEGSASHLGNCLRDILDTQRGRQTAAIVALTDGITTAGKPLSEVAQEARKKAIPLMLVGLGNDRPVRDLKLADLIADEAAFVGDLLHFDAKVVAEGYSGTVNVRLMRRGQESGVRNQGSGGDRELETLDQQTVQISPGEATKSVRLSHRAAAAGEYEYIVEIAPQNGEVKVENNRLSRKVTVRESAIRVLLVQAYPSYEFRFLKQMLLRELNADSPDETASSNSDEVADIEAVGDLKSSTVRTVLQEADLGYAASDKTALRGFPVSRDELFQYDVLIFGDVNPALLSPSIMQNIYEFVTTRGGGAIFLAGERYTPVAYRDSPLTPLFPMDLDTVSLPDQFSAITESFRPRLTPLGMASPMMQLSDAPDANERLWREELPPIRWSIDVPDLSPAARVLAEHPTRRTAEGIPLPIICLQFVGAGKVVFHATDETHRWRLRLGDEYFARYWVQTIRYLCRAKLLAGSRSAELTTDHEEFANGDPVGLRVRFLDDRLAPAQDDGVVISVERTGGERQSVKLLRHATSRGLFEGSAGILPSGQYRAWIASPPLAGPIPAHEFSVAVPAGEFAQTQMDSKTLREAAEISGGKFYTFATAQRLLSDLPRGRPVRIESLPPEPIWNSPLVAGLFVALIVAEWVVRKRVGLL